MSEPNTEKDRFRERLGHVTEVGGTEVGHGSLPVVLIVLFIFLMIWAALSWIPPVGTF